MEFFNSIKQLVMHNIEIYTSPEEIKDFVGGLWQTEAFKQSHEEKGGYVDSLISRFSRVPRAFGQMDDPSVEWSHFTAWMNLIARREDHYEGRPMISDLYYLHEIYHAVTMHYDSELTFEEWSIKMLDNERAASIESEVAAYFALPGIRKESFDFRIWADRFLLNEILLHPDFEDNQQVYEQKKLEFLTKLHMVRHRAMVSPVDGDRTEEWIKKYAENNNRWFYIWAKKYGLVEGFMEDFTSQAKTSRDHAARMLKDWFEENNRGLCPFEEEARAFSEVVERG